MQPLPSAGNCTSTKSRVVLAFLVIGRKNVFVFDWLKRVTQVTQSTKEKTRGKNV